MRLLLLSLLVASLGATVLAKQKWYGLHTTFSLLPITGFWRQPRLETKAKYLEYKKISGCGDNAAFPGNRYIPNISPANIVLIYDINGYIAGIQSIVPKNVWDNGFLDVQNNSMYQRDTINGEEVLLTTAYFVDPETICKSGRTFWQYRKEGTGYTLIFQNGKDISSDNLMKIPVEQSLMTDETFWKKHLCLFNMGLHYFNLNYDPEESCDNLFPVQLLFEEGKLHGFVWQHFGTIEGKFWEHPPKAAISKIVKDPPKCLNNAIDTIGLSTMHIYFKNYLSLCN